MTNYTPTTDFSVKDALPDGDVEKIILGSDVDVEFDAIQTAVNSKLDLTGGTVTGNLQIDAAGIVVFNSTGVQNENKGADIAAAATTDIGAATGNFVDVTGTATITALGTVQSGTRRVVRFITAGTILTHNATSLILLNAGNNITIEAGDVGEFISLGSGNWVQTGFTRATGSVTAPSVATGTVFNTVRTTAPSGFLLADGSSVSCTTEENLFTVVASNIVDWGVGTAVGNPTFDNSTDTWTLASHGLNNDDVVHLTNSGGALPTNYSANTVLFIINVGASDFQLSATKGGSVIDGTDNGTGTHSVHANFILPDFRGRFPLGADNMGGTPANRVTATQADNLGQSSGSEDTTQSISTMAAHSHGAGGVASPGAGSTGRLTVSSGFPTSTDGGSSASNIMNPYQTVNVIVKT